SSGLGVDDPNYTMETDATTIAANVKHTVGEIWDHTIKASLTSEKYKLIEGDPDPFNWYNSNIETKVKILDWQNNFYLLDEAHTITAGVEYEKAEAENKSASIDHSISNKAIYLQDKISLVDSKLNLLVGMRYDDHKKFGSETTYRVAASYLIDKTATTLRSSYGKAFKAPTLNDLYYNNPGVGRGNPNLEPEESKGYDLGIEQELIGKLVIFSASYFRNDFTDLIEWVEYAPWLYEPQNVAEANTKGWELGLEVKAVENLIIGASFTRTDTEDEAKKRELIRRPEKKGSLSLNWNPGRANFNLRANYVGKRVNNYGFFSGNPVWLDSYKKADFAASYDITDNINLFARVENLTNREYEEVKDYGTAGRSYYGGLKATF
ncbi:MAG: TonB-dependent receptor, partial [Proteobacteria bacterium]|nr:TonB-dependent receptor [Pseudomonadota bacterium]